MKQSLKISKKLVLVENTLNQNKETIPQVEVSTNHIFVIDVSYSMWNDLEYIRKQLKNKIPQLVKEHDTVSVVWFSGRHDAGVLMEGVEIKSLKSLQHFNEAVDKFLRPIGATAFHKPLVLVKDVIKNLSKNNSNTNSLIFLTDGYNNDCSWSDVTSSLKELESELSSSTFVEYGYYADSKAISEMAQLVGGEKVEAQYFDDYDILVKNKIENGTTFSKKTPVLIDDPNRQFDFVYTLTSNNEIILYNVSNENVVLIPENVQTLYWFSSKESSSTITTDINTKLYLSAFVLSDKLYNEYVEDVITKLGDQYLFDMFVNAYGKQKLFNLKNTIKECIFDESKRFLKGVSTNLKVDENAYCVMNMLTDLENDESVKLYPRDPNFKYQRIGAKSVVVTDPELTEEQKLKIQNVGTVSELETFLNEIKPQVAKFNYNEKNPGVSLNNLVWSTERANLSISVTYGGYVELPENKFGLKTVDSHIHRTYTIIKDGILNVSSLPVSLSEDLFKKFQKLNIIDSTNYSADTIYNLEFSHLPVINRNMVKNISAKELAEVEWKLLKTQALTKVYKHYQKEYLPQKTTSIADRPVSLEEAEWLKEMGVTSYGFSPKVTKEKGQDVYMAVELKTKIAGFSSIPSVNSVLKKIAETKSLRPIEKLMQPAIDSFNTYTTSEEFLKLDEESKTKQLEKWLNNMLTNLDVVRKSYLQRIAEIKFSLILSKKWFVEFDSFQENSLSLDVDKDTKLSVVFDMYDKEVEI